MHSWKVWQTPWPHPFTLLPPGVSVCFLWDTSSGEEPLPCFYSEKKCLFFNQEYILNWFQTLFFLYIELICFFKFSGLLCYDLWHWFYFFRFYFLIVYICVFVCLHGLRARACSTWEGQERDWISWITDSCEQPVLSVRSWTQILCYGSKRCQSLSIPPVCTWIVDTKFTF